MKLQMCIMPENNNAKYTLAVIKWKLIKQ